MKPVTVLILVLSLAGNATLGYLYFRGGNGGASKTQPTVAGSGSAQPIHEVTADATEVAPVRDKVTPSPATWESLGAGDDLRTMIANLRAAGFPPDVIWAVVNLKVGQQFRERYAAVAPPYWKRYFPTPEQVAAKQKLDAERTKMIADLLGADVRPSSGMSLEERRAKYGDLPDDKVDAVARIDRDYEQVAREARAGTTKNMMDRFDETRDQQALLEQQRMADIAAVLTPEELEEYKLHNSKAATGAMVHLEGVDVSEAEFEQVYHAQEAYDAATANLKMVGEIDPSTAAKRNAAMNAFNDQVKAALSDDRFYQYLEATDWRYAQMKKSLSGFPSVTPEATYELAKLQQEMQAGLGAIYSDKTLSKAQQEARRNQFMSGASARIDELLGPEAAAAYKKDGPGKQFNFPSAPKSGGG